MQFEVMKKSHKKEIIIGVIVLVTIAVVFIVQLSFAKYKAVKNMAIVSGTVNYTMPDFEMIAMYQQKANQTCTEDSCYDAITKMPASGYAINESKSYCNINNAKDTGAKLYTNSSGEHVISGIQKGSKCYVYFDNAASDAPTTILGNVTVKDSATSFKGVATTNEGVYKAQDDDGDTYYWRGAVTNNYVKFAGKFWRIIRINGDGTIRLIYQGTSATSTGADAQIGTSVYSGYNDNMYVGFKYTSGQVHGKGTESKILQELNKWYDSNLKKYENKIDPNAGFCNDREPSTSNTESNGYGGTGITETYYGAYIRFYPNYRWRTTQTPTFKCKNNSDWFTKIGSSKENKSLTNPIGLITADEVVYAGGFGGTNNSKYYLYTGRDYWTMSPLNGPGGSVFIVNSNGNLSSNNVNSTYGVRPVINLKADVTLTGAGTKSNPYVVQ